DTGDLNLNWLTSSLDCLKSAYIDLNLAQWISEPTRLNVKNPTKSTLIDLNLTNNRHKYTTCGVFAMDHCPIVCVRNTKFPKTKPALTLTLVNNIPEAELALEQFSSIFIDVSDKHDPMKRLGIKDRLNPWFMPELAELFQLKNKACSEARHTSVDDVYEELWRAAECLMMHKIKPSLSAVLRLPSASQAADICGGNRLQWPSGEPGSEKGRDGGREAQLFVWERGKGR
ncbi:unnamed protein product, partial [Coregonus sp. 'balchen']